MSSNDILIPVRTVNAFVFCPRLCWLKQVEGEWEDNHHTLEGQYVHRRVDQPGGKMSPPAPDKSDGCGECCDAETAVLEQASASESDPPWHTRSLWLSDEDLGVSGKVDYIEEQDVGLVMPVDTKKGRPPEGGGLWPADEVQLTLQALLLRAQGYRVSQIAAWYVAARKRVVVPLTAEMEVRARKAVDDTRICLYARSTPNPLIDSPRCTGCSLQPICLPDEINALQACGVALESSSEPQETRRIQPPNDDFLPLYIQQSGARVCLDQGSLKIKCRRETGEEKPQTQSVGMAQLAQLNMMGSVQITTQALQACMRAGIPISFFSGGGWFYGRAVGDQSRQIHTRIAQFGAHQTEKALAIARILIADKIANCRTLLRRNATDIDGSDTAVLRLKRLSEVAMDASSAELLLGIEGEAARLYWSIFSQMISREHDAFQMQGRNRRPPRDPSNALLSFGYALLVKDCTIATANVGLDPYLGVYHMPHHGQPAMALDLMEPFRPLIVDSTILQMVRRSEVQPDDFLYTGQAVAFKSHARKTLIRAYERRLNETITHPVFGYKISYRRILFVQARLLTRVLLGELRDMPSFRTR